MTSEQQKPKAIGFIRKDIDGGEGTDIHALAQRHGYRLVFTVSTDSSQVVMALALAQHIYEHSADAVVVPSFAHADPVRHLVTDLAALITPVQLYQRGHRWPTAGSERGQ